MPNNERKPLGVVLPSGHTGSSLFHSVLQQAVAQFPQALGAARMPSGAGVFKKTYGSALARFEAARVSSSERTAIARFIVRTTQDALGFAAGDKTVPLTEHLRDKAAPQTLERTRLGDESRLEVAIPWSGAVHRGLDAVTLAKRLAATHELTHAAAEALTWIAQHAQANGGKIDLRGRRFVILGAGAELAPTRALLQGGASVLWIDLADPATLLADRAGLSGELVTCAAAKNLLENPREIAAAIEAFAQGQPVEVGAFAYASGASQEWRLAVTMDAIVSSLDPAIVRSVSLLVSPTTASVWQPESVTEAAARFKRRPIWQGALNRAGLLPTPGSISAGGAHVGLSTVSIQGLSYQAAQYISKLMAAEALALHGVDARATTSRPIIVSANVAGITRTRSLSHPLFEAAFLGAPKFGVRIFDPPETRALSSLLMLHDLLNPQAPAGPQTNDPQRASKLFAQQVHGGIYCLPFALEESIRAAAVIGLGMKPSVLLPKKRKR
ncbi:MAG: hypothetical protein JST92_20380 [Deltaproteobacteria bacterium]|nr:hypothetical protein [Deltaproteobacteria bacterium]